MHLTCETVTVLWWIIAIDLWIEHLCASRLMDDTVNFDLQSIHLHRILQPTTVRLLTKSMYCMNFMFNIFPNKLNYTEQNWCFLSKILNFFPRIAIMFTSINFTILFFRLWKSLLNLAQTISDPMRYKLLVDQLNA